jgi:hypothetical protein
MKKYTARQAQRQFSLICGDADVDGGVIVVKGDRRYLLSPLPVDGDDKPAVDVDKAPVATPVDTGDTAVLGGDEVVGLLREQTALLRELVEQGLRNTGHAPNAQAAEVADPGKPVVTVRVDEEIKEVAPIPVEEEPTPEEVSDAFEPPEPQPESEPEETPEERARREKHEESLREARERERTGVLLRDGRWELTMAVKEAPKPWYEALRAEATEEERSALAALSPDAPEVLELIRVRGEALRTG